MKNTAIKLSGILLAGAVFFSTLLGYGTQVAAATAIGSDTEAGQASGDGSVASVADLPGKHIGVQLGTTGDIMVSDYETDGSGTVVERYNKGADAVQALKQGKLDCVIIDELPALAFVEQNEGLKILKENFVEEDYAFVIAKGNEALVDQVNETLRELKDEGVLDNIAKNYTGTDEEIGKYPYEILDVERTNGTLTVGTNAEFPPYEYYEEGKITGIDMDIMQAVCDKLGMELKIEDMAFDSVIPAVSTGKVDIGASGFTVTEERKKNVNFTDTYAKSKQVIIVRDTSVTAEKTGIAEKFYDNFIKDSRYTYLLKGLLNTLCGNDRYCVWIFDRDCKNQPRQKRRAYDLKCTLQGIPCRCARYAGHDSASDYLLCHFPERQYGKTVRGSHCVRTELGGLRGGNRPVRYYGGGHRTV